MKSWISRAFVVLIALGAIACAGDPDIKIGAILSLSGSGASYGTSIKNGVDLALDEINAGGGITIQGNETKPVTLIFRDAESDPRIGLEAAREVLDAGVVATIGSDISDVTLAIAPVFQEAGVVLLSPATSSPRLSAAGEYIFRNFPSDELEAVNAANHIYNQAGLRNVAVIGNQNEFGIGVKNAFIQRFRGLGGRLVAQTSYPPDATSFDTQVQELMEVDPPAIYIAGYTEDTAAVIQALRDAGSDAELFGTGAVLGDQLVAIAGEVANDFVFPHPAFDIDSGDEEVDAFVAAYEGKYGADPDVYAAHGYDAMKILALAIQEAGTVPDEIRFYLNSMNPYEGITGDTDFTETGDTRKFHTMLKVVDGEIVHVDEIPVEGEAEDQDQ